MFLTLWNLQDVIALAKILILKQITTTPPLVLLLTRCYCSCKDTNFKANHNIPYRGLLDLSDVIALAKILILKQITTPSP